ncbi:acyltransferase family protein [Gordonia zhaorongruii]|uniref:acyltransferase family protein n=1 Tax=Gordonia zhaorongruii TaxID=2597659 RepID=UPI0016425AA9|nr:acyltransferase [Gordonia zhaorongruii]
MTGAQAPARRFYPQLEGMRAVAALGVLTTHVAFQTASLDWPVIGPLLGRLDLAVALFFALSGFLLWRPYASAAHDADASPPDVTRYLKHRFVRIWPAYAVVVIVVLLLLPQARDSSLTVWLANLTLTQVFVPLTLAPGLTQMWSLSVEVAFYLLLPIAGYAIVALRGRRARYRVPLILGISAVSLTWAWAVNVLPLADGVEGKNWVFGHLPWFAGGLVLAEIVAAVRTGAVSADSRLIRWSSNRPAMLGIVVIAYCLASTPLAGPVGLAPMNDPQYAAKMLLGGIAAYAVLAPLVLRDDRFRFLESPVMAALGRWSYGIFIWHVAVLTSMFGLFGIPAFAGRFVAIWLLTVVITVPVSAASYIFLEEPCRRALSRREKRRRAEAELSPAE